MRFDDMAATVIAQSAASPQTRVSGWLQLVDLAAQGRHDARIPEAVFEYLTAWRGEIPLAERRRAAASLAGMPVPADLFSFFAADTPQVVAPLAATVDYAPDTWRALLPKLSPSVRALLRHRRDLRPEVVQALSAYGATDLIIAGPQTAAIGTVLPPAPAPVPTPMETLPPHERPAAAGGVGIRDLVNRIEAYRRERPLPFAAGLTGANGGGEPRAENFRFETGSDGVIVWIEGAPRGALFGLTVALTGDQSGVDGHVAGAFRRRAPFKDGRLTVAGIGPASGEWRISAVPFFTPRDGRFTGFRGTGRRPRIDEVALPTAPAGLYGTGLRPESLRQLVHELRTPLNAIQGFAEMIDGQILGPAARDYRDKAKDIRGEARRLLAAVDDLDTAARADSNALQFEMAMLDGAAALRSLCAGLEPLTDDRRVHLRIAVEPDLPLLSVDPVALDRMYGRLLSSAIAVAAPGETLAVDLGTGYEPLGALTLQVQRPAALIGQDERDLLDPGYTPEGDWPDAPLLGLGFALRLVRNIAEAAGGNFRILPDRFALSLPIAAGSAEAEGLG